MAVPTAKSLKRVPPPLQEPMVTEGGRLTPSWANYFVRLPLTFEDSSSRLTTAEGEIDQAQSDITVVDAIASEAAARSTQPIEMTWEMILMTHLMEG